MRRFLFFIIFVGCCGAGFSQPLNGSTGLLNIPTAEMKPDGTFSFGGNYLPNAITPEPFDYNTENYFLNIAFLPFLEFTYCSTFLKFDGNLNQDRAFGLRLRLLKESKYRPSLVTGGNDIYSSSGGIGSRYFNSFYVVTTKHFAIRSHQLGLTLGFGDGGVRKQNYNGFFGGLSVVPAKLPEMKLMMVYDSNVFSPGIEFKLWRRLSVFMEAYRFKYLAGGLSYQIRLISPDKKQSK